MHKKCIQKQDATRVMSRSRAACMEAPPPLVLNLFIAIQPHADDCKITTITTSATHQYQDYQAHIYLSGM